MRLVGELGDTKQADKFVGYLASQGIEAEVRDADAGRMGIWVLDEDRLVQSEDHFQRFNLNPNAVEFASIKTLPKPAVKVATPPRGSEQKSWSSPHVRALPVTYTVIGICFVLALLALLPAFPVIKGYLYFSEEYGRNFPEIRAGQIWRLVTPVFLHGNALHLFFNMLWMYQLGAEIEVEEGSKFLAVFLILTAIMCDVSQYLVSGPAFVGLSGVVYAFLGYIWIMSRRSLKKKYAMNDQTMVVMLIWLFICLVGIIPSVANTQHVVGLLCGLGWGWLRSLPPKRRIIG